MKKVMLGLVMVMMLMSLVGCGETKKEGFVPEQVTESEVVTDDVKEDIEEVIDTENLQKYYDVEKFVGTPKLVACRYMFGVLNPISEEEGLSMYQIEEDERLENLKHYDCIIVDNNTPLKDDDVVVYIFVE